MLKWQEGRLWSDVNPKGDDLLLSLGRKAGELTAALHGFDHPGAHRTFDWDIAQSDWTIKETTHLSNAHREIAEYFQRRFMEILTPYAKLRKSVVHNDVNDNNILVSHDLVDPTVNAIIDYGDAIHTQTINDLAITIAYAVMHKPDPLRASIPVIKGYHSQFPLKTEELELLFILVGMRLVTSVTKAAINKLKEPENSYLQVSEKPAWDLLEKWRDINEKFAYYNFRKACGLNPHPAEDEFIKWAERETFSIDNLIPGISSESVRSIDMSVASSWLGLESEYNDPIIMDLRIKQLLYENNCSAVAGGYLETRPLYFTDAYKKEGNSGPEQRSVHLGLDIWIEANSAIHSLFDGVVYSIFNNDNLNDYGPTIILEHKTDNGVSFFSLYGHLSKSTLKLHQKASKVRKGDLLGYTGDPSENGSWAPHLHFQLMLDMLGNHHDYPGVAFPNEADIWKSLCPDPNLLLRLKELKGPIDGRSEEIISFRKNHLGKSLSLSYQNPLHIVRGRGQYLIDITGRKYLDTVNNVAHVGHEHPRVVKAGRDQMATLNTNTRYLHSSINEFAEELLRTFPEELSVVHFVNSGSEANELALRMASTFTGRKDIIAMEVGYHGNTTGCINVSAYKFDGKGGKGKPENTHIVPLPDSFRGIYRGGDTGRKYAAHADRKIEEIRARGRGVAAFLCESIISCGGQIELPEGFLRLAYESVRSAGGICIADEVQTGCGRMGSAFWGFQLHGVVPDIVTIGKPLGNGHPVAAVVCTREIADAFANGMEYFNTFGGNPVSCRIGLEVLKVINDEKLRENALEVGGYLKGGLQTMQKSFPIIGDVRGQGLFLGFELVDENMKPLTKQAKYLINRMRDLGILMSTDGRDDNVIKIKPPMVFSRQNADEVIHRLETVLLEDYMTHK